METKVVHTHTGKIYFNPLMGLEFLTVGDYGKENNIKADFLGLTKKIDGVQHHDVNIQDKWGGNDQYPERVPYEVYVL